MRSHAVIHVQIHAHLIQCVLTIQQVFLNEWLHWMTTALLAVLISGIATMATTGLNHARRILIGIENDDDFTQANIDSGRVAYSVGIIYGMSSQKGFSRRVIKMLYSNLFR